MKRSIRTILCVLMASVFLLAGCTQTPTTPAASTTAGSTETTVATDSGKMKDLTKIRVAITCMTKSSDIKTVQNAINAITVPDINVEVELIDVTIVDALYASYFTLAISSGEQLDLIQLPFTSLSSYVTSGQLEPMDDLINSYAPKIVELSKDFPILDAGKVQGKTYGVDPVLRQYGYQSAVQIRQDYMDETGIDHTKALYTLDDMTAIFAAIKAKHPDVYPFTYANLGSSNFGMFNVIDPLGATVASGVLTDTTSTKIVDMLETPEYLNFLKTMREWNKAGYMIPDAATTDLKPTDLLVSGKCVAAQGDNRPDTAATAKLQFGNDFYVLPTVVPNLVATTSAGSIHWSVPVTSASPEAAARFMNLLYADSRIAQLMFSGVEGVHYVVNGDHIEFPAGVTSETATYTNGWDCFGDTRNIIYYTKGADPAAYATYTSNNMANPTKAVGYSFDTTPYTTQIMQIQAVINQYVTSLETGSVEDYEGTLKEMIQKVKAAGIDALIALNQASFDQWLASKK